MTTGMPSFPSEILLEILHLIDQEDLKGTLSSISQCSHQLHALTIPILYRSIYFQASDISLVAFARTIFSRPDYAQLVTSFGAENFDEYLTKENHLGDSILEIIEAAIELISGDDAKGADRWIRRVEFGDRDALTALLILKLPNLEQLDLEIRTTDICFTKLTTKTETLSSLTRASFTNGSRTFHVLEEDYSDFTLRDISPLFHFIKLKGLRSFMAQGYRGPVFDFTLFEPASLSIDDLFFVECDFDSCDFIRVVGWFGQLKRLRFDHRCSRTEYSYGKVPRDIGAAVAHLKSCLEELVVTDQSSRLPVSGAIPIGSMADYKVLKTIELPGFGIWSPQRRLRDILPLSLERLTLNLNYCDMEIGSAKTDFFGQLNELAQLKSLYFPNLKSISLEFSWHGIDINSYNGWNDLPEETFQILEMFFEQESLSYGEILHLHEVVSMYSPDELRKVFECGIQDFESLNEACEAASVKLSFLGLYSPDE